MTIRIPEKFEALLKDAKAYVENDPKKGGVVYINAWNEYAECPALVPTIRECDFMLRAVAKVFGRKPADKFVACPMKRWWDPKAENARAFEIDAPTFENEKYGSHYRQGVDVWLPEGAKKPVPCVVYIHGGAWTDGTRIDGSLRGLLPLCQKEGGLKVIYFLPPNSALIASSVFSTKICPPSGPTGVDCGTALYPPPLTARSEGR